MSAGTELVRAQESALDVGKAMYASGLFPDVKKAEQAVVKILAGREFGLGPVAAMSGIHIIDGKPSAGANILAGLIKGSGKYDYKVIRRDVLDCELEFFERGENGKMASVGTITFNKDDATRAGLVGKGNWRKYPKDMPFNRAVTAGMRTYCPDVTRGVPAYTPEEMGAENTDQYGAPVEAAAPVSTPEGRVARGLEDVSGNVAALTAAEAAREPGTVEGTASEIIMADEDVLSRLRTLFNASGHDADWLRFALLSVGVEDPTDIKAAMGGLTLQQALDLEVLLKGEDAAVPGSGEAAS